MFEKYKDEIITYFGGDQQMTEGFLLKLENMTDDEFREAIKG